MTNIMLTFVGTGKYSEAVYDYGGSTSTLTPYVQYALLEFIETGAIDFHPDIIMPLLTPASKQKNWESNHSEAPGLQALVEQWTDRQPDRVALQPLELNEQNDERAIWENFGRIYERIRELKAEDSSNALQILVDVTHSFRYQPMLMLSLLHFAKVVDGVQLYGAFYGSPPESTPGSDLPRAAVMDLSPLVELQDWVLHVQMFLHGANATGIREFIEQKRVSAAKKKDPFLAEIAKLSGVSKSWEQLTKSLQLTRGPEIRQIAEESLERIQRFTTSANELARQVPSLQPILHLIDQIRAETEPLAVKDDIKAGLNAVRWCQRNGLIQQAFTLLTELMITAVCQIAGWDLRDKSARQLASKILSFGARSQRGGLTSGGDFAGVSNLQGIDTVVERLRGVPEMFSLWNKISDLRNNLNHGGWRRDRESMGLNKFAEQLRVDEVERAVRKLLQGGDE
ncbi:MAG: TM1812 family CRISPR-associated protein [Alicyclobacillus sp.]|nr:TM1812 family CRISPR-associated protein [Alicyclobacillus sp.]